MAKRRLPHRPDLDHVRRQAKTLLADFRREFPEAMADFSEYHPTPPGPTEATLSDAQLTLARSYRFPSWPRLKAAVELLVAIDDQDLATLERVVQHHPDILREGARGLDTSATWGVPFAYATASDRPQAAALLAQLDGKDLAAANHEAQAIGLQQLGEWFLEPDGQGAKPGAVMHPCELLNPAGLEFLLEHGADLADAHGNRLAPVAQVLRTYKRDPEGKHRCLEICDEHGTVLPDTPAMAFHRGRVDLLEKHLVDDPTLLERRFTLAELFPHEVGFPAEDPGGLCGTPLEGSTLLHLCGEYDELEIARWLLDRGADPNATAAVDAESFGGHTSLFNAVVTCAAYEPQRDHLAGMLLDAGADPHRRASLRKALLNAEDEAVHTYYDVTAVSWGQRFHGKRLVNRAALRRIEAFRVG
ncbi:ankyrin repeat domain-containing protein [Algisphaera agarilytica]|uniref:Ankyrin repeat-containing protein n=1 Tax=Algisphaera agarilytica TaxID=1385975 RepID=A0A7X0H6P9_9BACT|nr:ankyrin repeat domain-containing protein [Algisphaera agarilytica]MBB6430249.1 hypothetical protein [Algisphaera agarilytica]